MQWLVELVNVTIRHSIEEYAAEQAKSADGVRLHFTVQEDYFVLKNRNEILGCAAPTKAEEREKESSATVDHQPTSEQETSYPTTEERVPFKNDTIPIPLPTMWNRQKIFGMLKSPNDKTDQSIAPPPVMLYLVGDRLDLALWTANAMVLVIYSYSDSISVSKFVLLLGLFNTTLAFCCGIIERNEVAKTKKTLEGHSSAAEFACRVEEQKVSKQQRLKRVIQPLAVVKKEQRSYDAIAGTTTFKLTNANKRKEGVICWMEVPPSDICIRSLGYGTTKKKIPSPGSLYECIAVDVLGSDERIPDIGSKVKLYK